jgi:hypothetical protein
MHGLDASVDEVYHALYLLEHEGDPRRVYGRRSAERMRRYVDAV